MATKLARHVIGVGPSVSGKCGARLERERRGQSADGRPIHAIGASDLSLRLAGRQPRQGLLTLERVELRFATELHAASKRPTSLTVEPRHEPMDNDRSR